MKKSKGYIALSSILVIAAVVVVIGVSVSLSAVNDIQSALSGKKAEESFDIVQSCAEDAIMRINQYDLLPTSISLPEGSCTITINSHAGNDWDFTVTGGLIGQTRSLRLSVTRSTIMLLNSINEI